ncbi:very short patch repair endonuclease [Methylophaga sp. OBS1]|uniref:very short patch repair endonuclease n=1 Tax=Methylophaga sp. OBS1 TaxID=2991933 RepID=UPI00224E7E1D|nr:DNA mismatch endonuclease Vsr [Methylophaga sp. OBS1]MCX4191018.1 DNA mismatch endonuclease Vsr [Methylophaga sp. OBS1]MCX4192036.1 DNA mismatch endonuclease Vsr [Methylophaga sp. OBS1]
MADVFDKETRSKNMSRIRAKDTKPELLIRRELHKRGYRYRLHRADLPGKPDMVLPKFRAVIEIRGCFWHGHNCHLFKWPKSRSEFWERKINQNIVRDKANTKKLEELGWRVLTVWECSIKGKTRLGSTQLIERIVDWIVANKNSSSIEGEI